MKTLKTIFAAAVFVLLGVMISTATPPRRPALEIKGKIQIEGNIKPGELITITFNFALIPEGQAYERMKYYFGDSNKTYESQFPGKDDFYSSRYDTAYIAAGDGLEFITPNSWRGRLRPDKTESITAKAILKSQTQIEITGIVGSFCGTSPVDNLSSQFNCDFFNAVTSEILNFGSTRISDTSSFDTIRLGPGDSILIRNVINNTPPPDSQIIIKTLPTPPPRKSKETRQLNQLPLPTQINPDESSRTFYMVSGRFQNVNPPHDTVPSVDTYGYMLYYDDEWYFDQYVYMDVNGYFSVYSDHPHIIIINNPVNIAATVFSTSDHQLYEGADIVYYNFGFELNNPSMLD